MTKSWRERNRKIHKESKRQTTERFQTSTDMKSLMWMTKDRRIERFEREGDRERQ